MSTSEFSNGSFTTFTHVVANPTDVVSGDAANDHTFLQNGGAVAGVFTVVGIIIAALAGCFFVICRRRRKQASRNRQWLANIEKRLPPAAQLEEDSSAFENPRDAPVIRSLSQDEHYYHFQSPSPQTARPFFDVGDDDLRSPSTTLGSNTLGLMSMKPAHVSPFSDPVPLRQEEDNQIGLAVTTDNSRAGQSRPSLAQSSPSIYPPTIPRLDNHDDDVSVYELTNQTVEEPARPTSYTFPNEEPLTPISTGPFDDIYTVKPAAAAAATPAPRAVYPQPPVISLSSPVPSPPPIRPARSALRETSKFIDQSPSLATPPESLSGHGHGNLDESERDSLPSPSGIEALIVNPISQSPIAVSVPSSSTVQSNQNPKLARQNSATKSIEDIVMRRTLLDVRPRPSRDNVGRI